MMSEQIDTEGIRSRWDLRELAGRYTTLADEKIGGVEQSGPCPKCGGEDRFHVTADWFFCRTCWPYENGEAHDVIQFVQWMKLAPDFRAACGWLGETGVLPAGNERKQTPTPKVKRVGWQDASWQAEARQELALCQGRLSATPGESGRAYLVGRGIEPETWRAWGLGCGVGWDGKLKRPRPALVIPWQRERITALKYRFIDHDPDGLRYTSKCGSQCIAFGLHMVGTHKQTLWLIEGELNALSLWQALRAVGSVNFDVVSFGSEGKASNVDPVVLRVAGEYRQVIVWADKPELARAAMAAIPGAFGLSSPVHDGGKLDANDLLQRGILAEFVRVAWRKFDRNPGYVARIRTEVGTTSGGKVTKNMSGIRVVGEKHDRCWVDCVICGEAEGASDSVYLSSADPDVWRCYTVCPACYSKGPVFCAEQIRALAAQSLEMAKKEVVVSNEMADAVAALSEWPAVEEGLPSRYDPDCVFDSTMLK